MKLSFIISTFFLSILLTTSCYGNSINSARAKFNYQMLCQGCHTPDGSGKKDVPELKDFIGNFLTNQAGREYLIQVPGSANSALNDKELAEVINWIIVEMAGKSKPTHFTHYQADEVKKYRKNPLFEVTEYRKQLLLSLKKNASNNVK